MKRAGLLVGLCVGVMAGQGRAEQLGNARISVVRSEAAMSCPDDPQLVARVARARASVPPPGSVELLIDVQIDRTPAGFRARFQVNGDRRGVRELLAEGESCEPLADALAVSLALLLDEEAQARSAPSASTAPSPPPPPPPPSPPRSPRETRGQVWLSLAGGAAWGLPHRGLQPALGGGVRFVLPVPLDLSLLGLWTPAHDEPYAEGTIAVRLFSARLEGCWRPGQGRFELAPCVALAGGALQGQGKGFSVGREVSRPFYALVLGGNARLALGESWGLGAGVGLFVPAQRERFVIDGRGVAYSLPALGAEATLSVSARLH